MNRNQLVHYLRDATPEGRQSLCERADAVRRERVGDEVHLRGLLEISNACSRRCAYCGLRADNTALKRYRMREDEILAGAHRAREIGCGTVVLQAGEDPAITRDGLARTLRAIRSETGLAITLSLGERPVEDYAAWREAGADRVLLRFESSNPALFSEIHPPRADAPCDRVGLLRELRELGYEIGSGMLVGLPGSTYDDLARDLELCGALDLDMIGLGPFVPNPETPLGADGVEPSEVPATAGMTLVVLALARLACPEANIPATTALATLDPETGYERGLRCGANVIMPNVGVEEYRNDYAIYPGKLRAHQAGEGIHRTCERLRQRLVRMGRPPAVGPGASRVYQRRRAAPCPPAPSDREAPSCPRFPR